MTTATAKIVEVMFEKVLETYEHQTQMLDLVDFQPMNGADAQNSSAGDPNDGSNFPHDYSQGVVWKPVQQHSALQEGYDLSDAETGIIEESYPCLLGTPKSDFFAQRADAMRDPQFWVRRGEQAGKRLGTELNSDIAGAISAQGALYYETTEANGFDALGIAQAMLNEREKLKDEDRFMVLSDRANLKFAGDLAGRGTLTNRPEEAYANGLIGKNVAGFDVYTGAYTPNQGASTASDTVSAIEGTENVDWVDGAGTAGNISCIPRGGAVDPVTGVTTNKDYRSATLTVTTGTNFAVGSKVEIVGLNAVALADKTNTGQLMTFTVIANTATSVTVFPRPITTNLDANIVAGVAAPDIALWRAYANCTGAVLGTIQAQGASVAGGRSNIFGCKNAIQVNGGTLPANLFNEFGGNKVVSASLSNGQEIYMLYNGNISTMTFNCRIMSLWGVTVADPSACGSFVATTA